MATTPKPLYHGQPAAAGTDCYTVPVATVAVVRHLRVVNPTGSQHSIDLYRYPSAGSASDATRVTETIVIASGESWEDDVYLPMASGDVLHAAADSDSSITLFVGGAEIT